MARSGSRSRSWRSGSGRLALAQLILFFVGMLTVFVGAFGMRDADDEVILLGDVLAAEVAEGTVDAGREVQEQTLQKLAGQIRLAHGITVGIGLLFVICAVLVNRMPVIATVSGLMLYLLTTVMLAMVDPILLTRGLVLRIVIIIALLAAVTSAIRTERRRNDRRRRHGDDEAIAAKRA